MDEDTTEKGIRRTKKVRNKGVIDRECKKENPLKESRNITGLFEHFYSFFLTLFEIVTNS